MPFIDARSVLLGASFLVVCSGTVVAGDDVGMPAMHVGDYWTSASHDGFTDEITAVNVERIVEVNEKEIVKQLSLKTGNNQKPWLVYTDRNSNVLDNGTARFEYDEPVYRFPVAVGDSWKIDYKTVYINGGSPHHCLGSGQATADETTTVQAGVFETIVLHTVFECRSLSGDNSVIQYDDLLWYAPAINHFAKAVTVTSSNGRVRSKVTKEILEFVPARQ
jgi:hypothetical protein